MSSIPLPCSTAALFQPTSLIWDSEKSSPVERRPPANQKWMLEARKPRIGNPPALTCRLAMGLHRQRRGPYRKPNGREAARGRLSAVFSFFVNQEFAKNLYIIHRKTTWIRPFSVVYYIGRKAPEPSRCAALAAGEQSIAPVRYYQKEVTSHAHLHPAAAARSARYRRSDL